MLEQLHFIFRGCVEKCTHYYFLTPCGSNRQKRKRSLVHQALVVGSHQQNC